MVLQWIIQDYVLCKGVLDVCRLSAPPRDLNFTLY